MQDNINTYENIQHINNNEIRIAVFGGTFNPVHNGHIHIAKEFLYKLNCDKMIIIPTKTPPHKKAHDLASGIDRLNMCKLAFDFDKRIEVSNMEIKRDGPSYTSCTLRELKAIYPNATLYFIMGTDMLITIEHWYNYKEIFALAILCAGARDKNEYKKLKEYAEKLEKDGANVIIKDIKPVIISSTQIRDMLSSGRDTENMLPDKVYDYIRRKGLYK